MLSRHWPNDYMASIVKSASVSLTLGVFIGSALTTGVAAGIAAAWVANEQVLRRLKSNVKAMLTLARDEALSTREGQALHQALLAAPEAVARAAGDAGAETAHGLAAVPEAETDRVATALPPPGLAAALRPGEVLPAVAPPGGHYLPFTVSGSTVYLSGYTSRDSDGTPIVGPCVMPTDVERASGLAPTTAPPPPHKSVAAVDAARTCALGHLAILQAHCGGLANVKQVLKVSCFVYAWDGNQVPFSESPAVANGYSDLVSAALGEAGHHARSAVAVAGLPGNAAVEVEAVVELWDPTLVLRVFGNFL